VITCRTCGSSGLSRMGVLPEGTHFAGSRLTKPLIGGELWFCKDCEFRFRHPVLTSEEYARLYHRGSATVWEADGGRQDFSLIREYFRHVPGEASVLDVGCYTGALLASLPGNHRLHGIEPNDAASRIAASRNVQVLAADIDDLHGYRESFDVVTVCDVIEHVENPLQFLRKLAELLKPGGRVLLTTGDSDSWLWGLLRSRFWYCSFPEHISFIGRTWMRSMENRIGLTVSQIQQFNYRNEEASRRLRVLLAAIAYGVTPERFEAAWRRKNGSEQIQFCVPGCGAVRDHMFCELMKVQ
jgi:SAM-dependent methyltransferase